MQKSYLVWLRHILNFKHRPWFNPKCRRRDPVCRERKRGYKQHENFLWAARRAGPMLRVCWVWRRSLLIHHSPFLLPPVLGPGTPQVVGTIPTSPSSRGWRSCGGEACGPRGQRSHHLWHRRALLRAAALASPCHAAGLELVEGPAKKAFVRWLIDLNKFKDAYLHTVMKCCNMSQMRAASIINIMA